MSIGRRIFDVDPLSGMTTWFSYDPITKTSILEYEQDVQDELDLNTAMKNSAGYTKRGIKKDWWHYGHIPDSICIKMLTEFGINVWSGEKEDIRRVFDFINQRDYNRLKTTELMHKPRTW